LINIKIKGEQMNIKWNTFKILSVTLIAAFVTTAIAIVPNQPDDFEDGTTQGWGSGNPNPNPPTNIATGGPSGADDNFLRVTSGGGSGAGSKLVLMNSVQWIGDYATAGITSVSMHIKNFGATNLNMRIALEGPGGNFWSINPIAVSASSDWQLISFPVQAANLTGGTNVNTTLTGVTEVRILHSVAGGFKGDAVVAQIGLDNITAVTEPVPVELNGFTASISGKKVNLEWSTSTETNNLRFDIQRKYDEIDWLTIGSVKGYGTTTQTHSYSFSDDLNSITSSKVFYRLKQIDFNGSFTFSDAISVTNIIVSLFELEQNYPNPFNPSTSIQYTLGSKQFVSLKVYNVVGKEVAALVNEEKETGYHSIIFNANDFPSGVYYYKISAGSFIQTKKMLLIK
jgi:hypothetical protein